MQRQSAELEGVSQVCVLRDSPPPILRRVCIVAPSPCEWASGQLEQQVLLPWGQDIPEKFGGGGGFGLERNGFATHKFHKEQM